MKIWCDGVSAYANAERRALTASQRCIVYAKQPKREKWWDEMTLKF